MKKNHEKMGLSNPGRSNRNTLRCLLLAALTSATVMSSADIQAGFFDKLKEKAEKAVEGAVDGTVENAKDVLSGENEGKSSSTSSPQSTGASESKGSTTVTSSKSESFSNSADAFGRWVGALSDRNTNHILSTAGFEILLSNDVSMARVSQLARRCVADLKATKKPGNYSANFLSGQEICGKNAVFKIAQDGALQVTWNDAPGVSGKTLHGQVERKYAVYPRDHWSSTQSSRKANDIVGFYPGMYYKDAKAHWQNNHKDLKREIRWVRDEGTSAIVIVLSPKEKPKAGQRQLKEQIMLGFETQTREELANVTVSDSSGNKEDLRRADSKLMYVYRSVLFADRKGPTLDTMRSALAKKYGPPSVDKKTAFRVMQWSYDKKGNRIANAEGGACDHWQRYSNVKLAPNYKPAQTARVPYITAHPDCGLTVKARISLFDGAVRELHTAVYDQQRLMGDQWYGLKSFNAALLAEQRSRSEALQAQDAPDL